MVRLILKKGVKKDVGDALEARAAPMMRRYGITKGVVAKGGGSFVHQGKSYDTYYVLSWRGAPDNCPVRRYVAYRDGVELKIIATLKVGFTTADLEAAEAVA